MFTLGGITRMHTHTIIIIIGNVGCVAASRPTRNATDAVGFLFNVRRVA